ncbi:uncharacterized protein L3040_008441 [Drepanopeziza brunnea f. sp. 'multigermtubi']|uniref:uncharacterized protein n=1 Tax=Drepanopeziza brunnea f. sp. 'multigermtubi' TaxID=698441 RepID=UPI00238F42A3|nr:hypothetical protein L3040_008441 [Drepanopeziza brunnea f. sp. 'multigermtubi']
MKEEMYVRDAKGLFLDGGASGILEILPCGNVIKSPWADPSDDCRKELTIEHEIYEKLGPHPRLIKIISWNLQDCSLTMEHMPKGNLHNFLLQSDTVTETQRLQWAKEAAEGLQLLHAADVIHCDVNPKNFMLDAHLGLKIADFSGSSLAGSKPSAYNGTRFSIPDDDRRHPPTVQDDLFALGTTIYFIMTSQLPFPELSEEQSSNSAGNLKLPLHKKYMTLFEAFKGTTSLNLDCIPVYLSSTRTV